MSIISTKYLLQDAQANGYAVPAFNIHNAETIQAILEVCSEMRSPVILAGTPGTFKHIALEEIYALCSAYSTTYNMPLALHLDHHESLDDIRRKVHAGVRSAMIDGSHFSFEENIAVTKKVVEYAHDHGVVVEGELGRLEGVEDDVKVAAGEGSYTDPDQVQDFVSRTGVDSLAIAIGTSHGAYKFKPGTKPQLRFDVLEAVEKNLPGFPIVLHGSSSVPQNFVDEINKYGGNMPGAIGVPEDQLRQAARSAVCKINIDSDLRLAMTATIRKYFAEHPADFDPRQYLKPARAAIKEMVKHKIVDVLGCDGKAD